MFATLKTELVHDADFATRSEAGTAIFAFIKVFYDREGLYSTPKPVDGTWAVK